MAAISNLALSIKKGRSRSTVAEKYDIYFSHCERLDESVFVEKVTLRGGDGILPDDHLYNVINACVKASGTKISRKHTRVVSNFFLDDDDSFFNKTDEVYARVSLAPFNPSPRTANTNIISSRF